MVHLEFYFILFYFILFYFILFCFYFILFCFICICICICIFFIILFIYLFIYLFYFIFLPITKLESNRLTWKYTLSCLQSQKSVVLYLSCSNYRTLYWNFSGTNELLAFSSLDRLFVRCTDSAAVLKTFFTTWALLWRSSWWEQKLEHVCVPKIYFSSANNNEISALLHVVSPQV